MGLFEGAEQGMVSTSSCLLSAPEMRLVGIFSWKAWILPSTCPLLG